MYQLADGYILVEDLPNNHYLFHLSGIKTLRLAQPAFEALKSLLYTESIENLTPQQKDFIYYLLDRKMIITGGPKADSIYIDTLLNLEREVNTKFLNLKNNRPFIQFLNIFSLRKHISLPYLQLFLLPSSVFSRAQWLIKHHRIDSIQLLGDDDLVSIAIGCLDKSTLVHIFDIDPLLIRFIQRVADSSRFKLTPYLHNLMEPVKRSKGKSIFATEPDDWGEGFGVFVGRGFERAGLSATGLVGVSRNASVGRLLGEFDCTCRIIDSCPPRYFSFFSKGKNKPTVAPMCGMTLELTQATRNPYKGKNFSRKRFYGISIFNERKYVEWAEQKDKKIQHCTIIFDGIEKTWDNREKLEQVAEQVIAFCGGNIIDSRWYSYTPYGITGIYILRQSSLSIHTWPELNKVILDIITCGKEYSWKILGKELAEVIGAKDFCCNSEIL